MSLGQRFWPMHSSKQAKQSPDHFWYLQSLNAVMQSCLHFGILCFAASTSGTVGVCGAVAPFGAGVGSGGGACAGAFFAGLGFCVGSATAE